ncbi:ATP-binding response regulator [Salegentibacter sp. F14]
MIQRYEVPAPCPKRENAKFDSVDILAAVGHEIRNPLNAIIGLSQLLYTANSMEEVKNYTEGLMQTSEHLREMVNNLLDFSKFRSGKLEMNFKSVALKETLASQLSGHRLVAERKGLNFFMDMDKAIPTRVVLDSLKLGQVILNLISNSIKFTSSGSVGLRVVLIRKTDSDVQLLFSVEDTGMGISKEHLEKIFRAFHQGDGETNINFGGTGLGLAISKQLVEAMGGSLVVESAPGYGSKFSFKLRAPIEEQEDIRPLPTNSWKSLKGLKILLVDDSKLNCMIVQKFLESKEMLCTTAENGAAGLDLIPQHDFDVILTDLKMPEMDGYEFIEKFLEFDPVKHKTIPVIALTGSLYGHGGEELRKNGFSDYLLKPFGPEELFSTILANNNKK